MPICTNLKRDFNAQISPNATMRPQLDLHVGEVSPRLPSPVRIVDEDGAVGDGAVPRDLQAVRLAQVNGEVNEEDSLWRAPSTM